MTTFATIHTLISNLKLGDDLDQRAIRRMVLKALPSNQTGDAVAAAIDDFNSFLPPLEYCLINNEAEALEQSRCYAIEALNALSLACQMAPSARLQ